MPIRKTSKEFVDEIKVKFPNINVLDEYKNMKSQMKFQCSIHSFIFVSTPINIMRTTCGCPICKKDNYSKAYTNDVFVSKLAQISPNIFPLSKYKNMKTKVLVRCKECGNEWNADPQRLLYEHTGCKKCFMKHLDTSQMFSQEQFISEVKKRNNCSDTFDVIGAYKGTKKVYFM